jgi:hypothetical protein
MGTGYYPLRVSGYYPLRHGVLPALFLEKPRKQITFQRAKARAFSRNVLTLYYVESFLTHSDASQHKGCRVEAI